MQRYQIKLVGLWLVLGMASASVAMAQAGVISGVVRDSQGVTQMGALVQVLTSGSAVAGAAFTDLHGKYVISNVIPGRYQVRASAALFVPAQRADLQLRAGGRAVVNLTLNALYDTTVWLPAERRRADEPADDWKWTLRSSVNRPILRMVDHGNIVLISSSAAEKTPIATTAKGAVLGGDGTFGGGGVHNVLSLDRVLDDGSDVIFRAEVGTPSMSSGGRPSMEMQTGYQRRLGQAGATKMVVSYQSHPEMASGGAAYGLTAMEMAGAQRMQLGDTVEVEVGNTLQMVRTVGYVAASRPFLRVNVHPANGWAVGYRMATARELQAFDGLNEVQPELPVAVVSQGRMRMESGMHQELSLTRNAGKAAIRVAYYHDALDNVPVSGVGGFAGGAGMPGGGVVGYPEGFVTDTSNGSFRTLAHGYSTDGMSFTVTQALSPGVWAAVEYSTGAALAGRRSEESLETGVAELKAIDARSATVALRGRVVRSGTNVRIAYRWQPVRFVSAINPYAAFGDEAYFSFYVRQPLRCGNWLPPGLEATVDVTNLLAQGYQPMTSGDGQPVFLAQAPRAIQGGLAFNF